MNKWIFLIVFIMTVWCDGQEIPDHFAITRDKITSHWSIKVFDDYFVDQGIYTTKFDGYTDCVVRTIWIKRNASFPETELLMHEILHAWTCGSDGQVHNFYYQTHSERKHEGIDRAAMVLSTVFRENPGLADWIDAMDNPRACKP